MNPQDAIIIQLLLEGIEIHEFVHLKRDSLDAKNQMLTLKNSSGNMRHVRISAKCTELFRKALQQTEYVLNNGIHPSKHNSVHLRDSMYLIKVSTQDFIANRAMITQLDSVILRTIYMRLRRLADVFSTPELTYLTTEKLEMQEAVYA